MFDKTRLNKIVAQYKLGFGNWWECEKYRWQAVKTFQDNWDEDAEDFASMLEKSLSGAMFFFSNIGSSFSCRAIKAFAREATKETRAMFHNLYDETQGVYERIEAFKKAADKIFTQMPPNLGKEHYQNDRCITIYLWLRFPDKYYVFMLTELQKVAAELQSDYIFKPKEHETNVLNSCKFYDEICTELKKDSELVALLKSKIQEDSTCYEDPELKTLTGDISYFIKKLMEARETKWLPENKNPLISVAEWRKLLADKEIFNSDTWELLDKMRYADYGIKWSDSERKRALKLTERVAQEKHLDAVEFDPEHKEFWPIAFFGCKSKRSKDLNTYKLREELVEALKSLSNHILS